MSLKLPDIYSGDQEANCTSPDMIFMATATPSKPSNGFWCVMSSQSTTP